MRVKIAISNIAWRPSEEDEAAALLEARGVRGVEIAPTAIWADPPAASARERRTYRAAWKRRGIAIVALQSLLFGRPDLTMFEDAGRRATTIEYLKGLIALGADLGAGVLVFGAPRVRQPAGLSPREVDGIAVPFFAELGRVAREHGVRFCIEPVPRPSGCGFVTTIREGLDLVGLVDTPGFGLHLDAASIAHTEDAPAAIETAGDAIAHFHASERGLAPVGSGTVDHAATAAALRRIGYARWVSIEMRAADEGDNLARVDAAIRTVRATYGAT